MAALIFALTFVVVTLLILGIWVLATTEPGQEVIRRRMEAVRKAERRGDVSLELKLARDEMLSSVPWIHRLMLHWAWSTRLQAYIAQAGLQMKAAKLVHPKKRGEVDDADLQGVQHCLDIKTRRVAILIQE